MIPERHATVEHWRGNGANGTIDAAARLWRARSWTHRERRLTKTEASDPGRPQGNRWVIPAVGVLLVAMVALAIVAFSGSGGGTPRQRARDASGTDAVGDGES
jgi:hypothetical protein